MGTITAPESSNSPPCLTPLRRGEIGAGSSGDRYTGRFPPLLNNCMTPSRAKPQREQKRTTPATCCWPHCGQNMGTVPRQTGCYVELDNKAFYEFSNGRSAVAARPPKTLALTSVSSNKLINNLDCPEGTEMYFV